MGDGKTRGGNLEGFHPRWIYSLLLAVVHVTRRRHGDSEEKPFNCIFTAPWWLSWGRDGRGGEAQRDGMEALTVQPRLGGQAMTPNNPPFAVPVDTGPLCTQNAVGDKGPPRREASNRGCAAEAGVRG